MATSAMATFLLEFMIRVPRREIDCVGDDFFSSLSFVFSSFVSMTYLNRATRVEKLFRRQECVSIEYEVHVVHLIVETVDLFMK
jgi:hypothetical protein